MGLGRMNLAEVLAATLAAFLASVSVVAYLLDASGFDLMPSVVLAVSVTSAATVAWRLSKDMKPGLLDAVAWAAVVIAVLAWLLRMAWPSLLPPGRGSDLAHHLLLVDYIERARHLVHDGALDGAMGEMAHYTPGAHLMAVLFGGWTGSDGFRVFYSVIAVCAALTAGFTFLVARRQRLPIPFAVVGVILLLLPRDYFVGAFTHDAFLAQAVCTCFSVAAWWALVAWAERPATASAAVFGLFTTGAFLAWPVWVGPPLLVFLAWLLRRQGSIGWRLRHLAVAVTPLAVVATIHAAGRLDWVAIVRTSGAVLKPSLAVVGWVFPLLAAIGLATSIIKPRARVTIAFLAAIAVQTVTLFFLSKNIAGETPYMAYKMGYLAIYPLAILGALALHSAFSRTAAAVRVAAGWTIAILMTITIVRPAIDPPRQAAVVSVDLYNAGRWMRANVGPACADYLVASADTAYWLHLAVLGNPRSSARTAEVDLYSLSAEIGRWITGDGQEHAVVDWGLVPDEVRSRVEVAARFGGAAVIRRGGAADCLGPGPRASRATPVSIARWP